MSTQEKWNHHDLGILSGNRLPEGIELLLGLGHVRAKVIHPPKR
jgi:hypothetical protein